MPPLLLLPTLLFWHHVWFELILLRSLFGATALYQIVRLGIGDVSRCMKFSHTAAYDANLVLRIALFGLLMRRRSMGIPLVTESRNWRKLVLWRLQRENNIVIHLQRHDSLFYKGSRYCYGATVFKIKLFVVRKRPVGASIVGRTVGKNIAF